MSSSTRIALATLVAKESIMKSWKLHVANKIYLLLNVELNN